jgi:hypothetical protein
VRLPSLAISLVLVVVCGGIWVWALLVVIHSDQFRVIRERIPPRLRPLAALPVRVHERLRMRFFLSAHP